MNDFLGKANKYIKKYKLDALRDVILFILITLAIHYSYRYWAEKDYWPISQAMHTAHNEMSDIVFRQSVWFIGNVLPIPITTSEPRTIHFENTGYIGINEGCSGLKQIIQLVLLFLLFPGPWKKKLWFIPAGILIVHLTNLFRIIGLAVVTVTIPQHWDFSHDYVFRPFFYVVIFLLWMWWVERLARRKKPVLPQSERGVSDL